MDMALRADRFVAEPPRRIRDHSKKQVAGEQVGAPVLRPHIHRNGIDGIGSAAPGVAQARADRIQAAEFADGPEDARAEVETERIRCRSDLGMPHARHLTNAFMVAHSSPGMAGRIVYSPTAAGTMNVSA